MLHPIKELINSGYNRPLELTAHQKLTLTHLGLLKNLWLNNRPQNDNIIKTVLSIQLLQQSYVAAILYYQSP
jgi:hypothetical protein